MQIHWTNFNVMEIDIDKIREAELWLVFVMMVYKHAMCEKRIKRGEQIDDNLTRELLLPFKSITDIINSKRKDIGHAHRF